jgi:hypothetical protein
MKTLLAFLTFAMVVTTAIVAQQPQNPNAPVSALKAKYVQGSYDPTPGTGLVLNLGGGTANCTGTIVTYTASTLTMSASTTNYVYLNTSSSCIPAVKTTSFTASDIPIAVVVTNGTAIVPTTGITDARASLQENAASGLANDSIARLAAATAQSSANSALSGSANDSTARTALSGSANDSTARTALSGSADDSTARSAASNAQSTANAAQPAIPNLTVDSQGNMTTTKQITASTLAAGATDPVTIGGASGSCTGLYAKADGTGCGNPGGSGTVNSGTTGQIAYYPANGTAVSGENTVPITAGGTGATTAAGALANLGGAALTGAAFTGPVSAPSVTAGTTSDDGFTPPSIAEGTTSKILMSTVWDRKGPIGYTSNPCNVVGEPSVIQDANSQLLGLSSGTVVFKTTGTSSTSNICYAESLNGVNGWVSAATPILLNHARSQLVHQGSTYYVYAVPMPLQNRIEVYTASSAANLAAGILTTANLSGVVLGQTGATILTPGSGQTDGTYTINGAGGGGTGAQITVTISGGAIVIATVSATGSGYATLPTFTATAGGTPGTVTSVLSGGKLQSGAWDDSAIATGSILVDGSTWRMLYQANGVHTNGYFQGQQGDFLTGTATSTDGINWVKYSGNPVMGADGTYMVSGSYLWKDAVTGFYWAWAHVAYPGAGVGDLPTDIARFVSTDFNTWTQNPANTLTFPRIALWEGANNLGGQVANPVLIQVGSATYLYNSYVTEQFVGSGNIEVSIAPYSLHDLVGTDEGATISYTGLSNAMNGAKNNWWSEVKVNGAQNLNSLNCSTYISTLEVPFSTYPTQQSNGISQDCHLYYNPNSATWGLQSATTNAAGTTGAGLLSLFPAQTSLDNTEQVVNLNISSGGSYTVCPTGITFGSGSAAATPICATVGSSLQVINATVTNGGTYGSSAPSVAFTGGTGTAAVATAVLAPRTSNIAGLAIYSAPGSYAGINLNGNYSRSTFFGKDAATDKLIYSTETTPILPAVTLFSIDPSNGNGYIDQLTVSTSTANAGNSLFSLFSTQTSLGTGSATTEATRCYGGVGIFCGTSAAGYYLVDMFYGKDATTDDFIVSTTNTTSPSELFRAFANGNGVKTPGAYYNANGILLPSAALGNKSANNTGAAYVELVLTGTTGTITGTALTATCDSGTATVTGAVVGHPVAVSSTTGVDVGGAFNVRASVTATGVVTVYVCGTGTPASLAYNVTVL